MLKNVWNEQKPLIVAASVSFGLFIILAIISLFDSTQILGVNRWHKPMKFTISPAIYMWTLAVYLYFVNGFERGKKIVSFGVIAAMGIETFFIIMQAARGKTSHFNVATPLDGMIFSGMGLLILFNTFLIVYLLNMYFRSEINLPKSIVWAMRLGIILFILSSLEGGLMSAMMSHSVGTKDGGEGLPFLNWSTVAGDLRIAHFVGLHALQTVPLFAWFLERKNVSRSLQLTWIFAAFYFAFFTFVFVQALLGQSLFR